jgi:hypothetical protein
VSVREIQLSLIHLELYFYLLILTPLFDCALTVFLNMYHKRWQVAARMSIVEVTSDHK